MMNYRLVWTHGLFSVDQDKVWFVPYWMNALCMYNLSLNKMEKVIHFPNQTTAFGGYFNVQKVGNLVIVIPAFEKLIYIYDIANDTISTVDIAAVKCQYEKFLFCAVWQECVYLFPVGYDRVIKLDLRTKQVTPVDIIDDNCKMFAGMTQIGANIYLVNQTADIYLFDMIQEKFSVILGKNSSRKYRTITHHGDRELVLSDSSGNIYLQSLDEGGCEKPYITGNIPYDSSLCIGDSVFFMPLFEKDYFVKIDIKTKVSAKIDIDRGNHYLEWPHMVFSQIVRQNNSFYFFSTQYRKLFLYDTLTGESKSWLLEMPPMSEQEMEEMLLADQGMTLEGPIQYALLENYIHLARRKGTGLVNGNRIGKEIYEIAGKQ